MGDDIGKILRADEREKKRVGSSIRGRASRGKGYKGRTLFPVDLLKGKKKREYTKPGQVVEYNMYDEIVEWSQFEKLSLQEKRKYYQEYKRRHGILSLAKKWNIFKLLHCVVTYE